MKEHFSEETDRLLSNVCTKRHYNTGTGIEINDAIVSSNNLDLILKTTKTYFYNNILTIFYLIYLEVIRPAVYSNLNIKNQIYFPAFFYLF